MYKTRVEVTELGDLYIVIPEDIIQDFQISEGDIATFFENDDSIELSFE